MADMSSFGTQEDSIMLWKEICQNPLLSKTTLILFLNKVRDFLPRPAFRPCARRSAV